MNWATFFAMGGYAQYVWSAYALAALVLVVNALQPLVRRRSVLKRLRNYYQLKSKTR